MPECFEDDNASQWNSVALYHATSLKRSDMSCVLHSLSARHYMFPAYVHRVSSGFANFDEFDDHWTMSP